MEHRVNLYARACVQVYACDAQTEPAFSASGAATAGQQQTWQELLFVWREPTDRFEGQRRYGWAGAVVLMPTSERDHDGKEPVGL